MDPDKNKANASGPAGAENSPDGQAGHQPGFLTRIVLRTPLSPYRQSGVTLRNYLRNPRLIAQKGKDVVERRLFARGLASQRPGSVVMFHIGRSGSTVLSESFKQHPQVYWDGEIYEKQFQKWERRPEGIQTLAAQADPLGYLQQRMRLSGRKYYGFEVKFFHLQRLGIELPEFIDQLRAAGITHFVILERVNTLRKIVSSVVAHQKKRFHQSAEVKTKLNQIHLDVDSIQIDRDSQPLRKFIQDYSENFHALKRLLRDENVLHLTYEEDVQVDPKIGYAKLCRFLDLEPVPVTVPFGRINPFLLRDMLTNFNEVEAALKGSPYEWMLDE